MTTFSRESDRPRARQRPDLDHAQVIDAVTLRAAFDDEVSHLSDDVLMRRYDQWRASDRRKPVLAWLCGFGDAR